MSDYGGITVSGTLGAGDPQIDHADDTVGISATALTLGAGEEYTTDDTGNLVILGQLTYRPVRFDQDGRIIVCERIT